MSKINIKAKPGTCTDDTAILISRIITRDSKMLKLVKKHFTYEDCAEVRRRMIGTGLIGGKACGMLLARAIIRNREPEVYESLAPHDSFYVGSDLYLSYIIENGLWSLKAKQTTDDGWFKYADELREHILNGKFSQAVREQFGKIIGYYGQTPFIVRSSSVLEDGFGNAFAGKYDSVFCANQGSFTDRLNELERAVKAVYASTMSPSALDYRKRRRLDKNEEQMALLIQRVSGLNNGSYYMPLAAGVGYSYSPYRFSQYSQPEYGMLRLVAGLGTTAVDRSKSSYPAIVSLDTPERTVHSSSSERHKYSQRTVEVLNMEKHGCETLKPEEFEALIPYQLKNLIFENDTETETFFKEIGKPREVRFISCRELISNKVLMENIRRLLSLLQAEYQSPVNIEFTINPGAGGGLSINLLQCRPIQYLSDNVDVKIPDDIDRDKVLLESTGSSMGLSRVQNLDYVVYVDSAGYYNLPYSEKSQASELIGKINRRFRDKRHHMILITPGRIGTSSPELGVPTEFSDISAFCAICETEETRAGYNPELSYGSHIFQDLVEENILYTAVFNNKQTIKFSPEKLESCENVTASFTDNTSMTKIVKVFKPDNCMLYYNMTENRLLITL